jgi:hypothetical protein
MSTLKTTNLQNPSAGSPALVLNTDGTCSQLGFRNAIINGNPIINQRGYVSGTSTTGANQYTLDRWRVVTSGESITWTDSNNIRTVTAPSGGVEQVIEGINILSGTYTLNWTGTATATVDGNAVSKGGNVTLTGGTNCTVRFSSGTFSLAQLESGSVATPFERRSFEQEFGLCRRYFQQLGGGMVGFEESSTTHSYGLRFMEPMRASPTFSLISSSFIYRYINASSVGDRTITISINGATTISAQAAWLYLNDVSTGSVQGRGAIERNGSNYINASAEL